MSQLGLHPISISIHALREEGDFNFAIFIIPKIIISIHALREEGDVCRPVPRSQSSVFQSTPSVRRATIHPITCAVPRCIFQSTPSARRATIFFNSCNIGLQFQSTPSARRATVLKIDIMTREAISIHALCEEGDSKNL